MRRNADYLAASAFEKVFVQPASGVGLTGSLSQGVFFRDLLDKIGFVTLPGFRLFPSSLTAHDPFVFLTLSFSFSLRIHMNVVKRYQFKGAMEPFTENDYTEPTKNMMTRLFDGMHAQLIAGLASNRHLTLESAK